MGALPLCGDALRSCGEGVTFKLSNVQQSVVFHISFWRGLELYLEVLSLLNPPRGDGTSSDLHKVFLQLDLWSQSICIDLQGTIQHKSATTWV